MAEIKLETPLTKEELNSLKAGDKVLLSGVIYTGRDAAHQRIVDAIKQDQDRPFDLAGQVIYYVGPCPAKPGKVIGSAGPTTSYRMDPFAPTLIKEGLAGMIGKGDRNQAVVESMKEHGAVYFAAIGGAAALIAERIKSAEVIAYDDLGTEAVRRLEVEELPVLVAIDTQGKNLYQQATE